MARTERRDDESAERVRRIAQRVDRISAGGQRIRAVRRQVAANGIATSASGSVTPLRASVGTAVGNVSLRHRAGQRGGRCNAEGAEAHAPGTARAPVSSSS